ncbi:hypothetical protein ColTof4_13195 [Colletotrichum tofieldiae]|nr:hypothetical protein ColTof3_00169 [Colletotrichum tofieldiae]GKT80772.1 hypothetical protein ColTof4_13195 [Colletotrichum tofieldiae]GKT88901.1 hypothetical protein Ct61P_06751 [Colletotrichum tofieldiae]
MQSKNLLALLALAVCTNGAAVSNVNVRDAVDPKTLPSFALEAFSITSVEVPTAPGPEEASALNTRTVGGSCNPRFSSVYVGWSVCCRGQMQAAFTNNFYILMLGDAPVNKMGC